MIALGNPTSDRLLEPTETAVLAKPDPFLFQTAVKVLHDAVAFRIGER